MRREPAPAERILWTLLRTEQLRPFKFRRQHPVGPYIVDFYSHAAVLVVELDGESHLTTESQERDGQRSAYLGSLGIHVERFWNPMVFDDSETVIERIYNLCVARAGVSRTHHLIHTPDAIELARCFNPNRDEPS
ncbi:endonuclease domain-containing protein [Limnoglobus roseus]